jgi:cytochrome c peroxidase
MKKRSVVVISMEVRLILTVLPAVLLLSACRKETPAGSLTDIPYAPEPVILQGPQGFPSMEIPPDNPTTLEGIDLGRRLFYDPVLSADYSMSCASCHLPGGSFTDNLAVSKGIDGTAGRRSSMSLLNIGFADQGLFWDGRSTTLEDQALLPVEDTIELHNTWTEVVDRLQEHDIYPELFRRAFGIERKDQITKELAAKAIAQFERTLISSGQSKYDRFFRGEVELSDEEFLGYVLFFDLDPDIPDAECGHCHNAPLFTTNQYFNNGIEPVSGLESFPDQGRGAVSGDNFDNAAFGYQPYAISNLPLPICTTVVSKPSEKWWNTTTRGGHFQVNKDPLIRPLGLLDYEKEALIAFIKTLSDTAFIQEPAHQNPFE